jgi:hypothetical protein
MQSIKIQNFIGTIKYEFKLLEERFYNVKDEYNISDHTSDKNIAAKCKKIENSFMKAWCRLEYLLNSKPTITEDIKQSFKDMIREIDWYINDLELALIWRDILNRNKEKSINDNHFCNILI